MRHFFSLVSCALLMTSGLVSASSAESFLRSDPKAASAPLNAPTSKPLSPPPTNGQAGSNSWLRQDKTPRGMTPSATGAVAPQNRVKTLESGLNPCNNPSVVDCVKVRQEQNYQAGREDSRRLELLRRNHPEAGDFHSPGPAVQPAWRAPKVGGSTDPTARTNPSALLEAERRRQEKVGAVMDYLGNR
jgi:hypothetical protein